MGRETRSSPSGKCIQAPPTGAARWPFDASVRRKSTSSFRMIADGSLVVLLGCVTRRWWWVGRQGRVPPGADTPPCGTDFSAYAWRRARVGGGEQPWRRKAPGPQRRLSDARVRRLAEALQAGPAAAGWIEDQRGTSASFLVDCLSYREPRLTPETTREPSSGAQTQWEDAHGLAPVDAEECDRPRTAAVGWTVGRKGRSRVLDDGEQHRRVFERLQGVPAVRHDQQVAG